jgi:uncharacterized membrane protein YfcA
VEIAGYIASVLIGISLGLIGGGGSILTVPVLVYLFAVEPVLATGYSLFIVGATALVGGIQNIVKKRVSLKTAVVFAIPSFIAVFLTRRYLVPTIPEELFLIGDFVITRDLAIMVFFALIMIAAAITMIRDKKKTRTGELAEPVFNFPMIVVEGLVVGVITGVVGAGGGFLIIPALVLFARLPMKVAVGTSLLIISAKSLLGFLGDVGANQAIDWTFLLAITAIAIIGIFIGTWLSHKIDGKKLKAGFGWFVLIMAVYIIIKETLY